MYVVPPYLSHPFAGTSPPPNTGAPLGAGATAAIVIVILLIAVLVVAIVIVGVIWWRKRSGEWSCPELSHPVDKFMCMTCMYVHTVDQEIFFVEMFSSLPNNNKNYKC